MTDKVKEGGGNGVLLLTFQYFMMFSFCCFACCSALLLHSFLKAERTRLTSDIFKSDLVAFYLEVNNVFGQTNSNENLFFSNLGFSLTIRKKSTKSRDDVDVIGSCWFQEGATAALR